MKILKLALLISLCLVFSTLHAQAKVTYVWDMELLSNARQRLGERQYNDYTARLMRDAQKELLIVNPTVVDKPMLPASGDKHDYMSMGRYWWPNPDSVDGMPYIRKDGQSNPELFKYDRDKLGALSKGIVKLSLAWYFSENSAYAQKVVSMLDTWFIDERTKMNPNMNFGQIIPGRDDNKGRAEGIIDSYSFVAMIDAVMLLYDGGQIAQQKMDTLRKWFGDYVEWMSTSELGIEESNAVNNHSVAYDVQVVVFSAFAGNDELSARVLEEFPKRRVATQIEIDGKQPRELARTTGFGYSTFNLEHFLDMCMYAKKRTETNLYVCEEGKIGKALDYLLGFVDNQPSFPYKQISDWKRVEYSLMQQLRRAMYLDNNKKYEATYIKYEEPFNTANYIFGLLWQ